MRITAESYQTFMPFMAILIPEMHRNPVHFFWKQHALPYFTPKGDSD